MRLQRPTIAAPPNDFDGVELAVVFRRRQAYATESRHESSQTGWNFPDVSLLTRYAQHARSRIARVTCFPPLGHPFPLKRPLSCRICLGPLSFPS